MARRKLTYYAPGKPPRLPRDTVIESTFRVGRHYRCTMRLDCAQLEPGAVLRPAPLTWEPKMPARLIDEELADFRAGRDAVYLLAAHTIGGRIAVAEA
jgi:hypothetical protein